MRKEMREEGGSERGKHGCVYLQGHCNLSRDEKANIIQIKKDEGLS